MDLFFTFWRHGPEGINGSVKLELAAPRWRVETQFKLPDQIVDVLSRHTIGNVSLSVKRFNWDDELPF